MNAYRKEAVYTVGFFILYLLAGHTAPWAILFGVDNSIRILGFPLHYFAAVVLGWVGVLAVSIWWNRCADALEEEITGEIAPHASDASNNPVALAAGQSEGERV